MARWYNGVTRTHGGHVPCWWKRPVRRRANDAAAHRLIIPRSFRKGSY